MKSMIVTVAATPLALAALTGCSGQSSEPDGFHVASGVQEQYEVLAEEIEEKGKSVESGEWTVNLITEAAEPWHEVHEDGHASYRDPKPGETNHIEIIPIETSTGRIVPEVPVTVEVIDENDRVVQKLDLNFYYSTFYHYANNFSLPQGTYTVKATLGAPTFLRHGEKDETPALAEGATVEFSDVELGAK